MERRTLEKQYGPIRLTSVRLAHASPNYLILARVLPLVHTVIHYMDNIVMTVLFLSIQNREAGPCVATQQVVCWTVWVAIFSPARVPVGKRGPLLTIFVWETAFE